jgi:hypothetical protein
MSSAQYACSVALLARVLSSLKAIVVFELGRSLRLLAGLITYSQKL